MPTIPVTPFSASDTNFNQHNNRSMLELAGSVMRISRIFNIQGFCELFVGGF